MNGDWPSVEWVSLRKRALAVGLMALGVCLAGGFVNAPQFFRSYLSAYIFWAGVPAGCLALLMLHHLVGGRWGFVSARILESGIQTFPLMALLFLPIVFGMADLYPWARTEVVSADPLLQQKNAYLNLPFFVARAASYFLIWIVAAYLLRRWSVAQDRTADAALTQRLQRLSGPGLILYGLSVTFSAIDWMMSLEPRWYSTIFAMIFMVSYGLAALALVILMARFLKDEKALAQIFSPDRFHDLGNLLLAFVMLWAYLSFAQFLLIWVENLRQEIPWYLNRTGGGWQWVALALVLFQFALPFVLLLSRAAKRNSTALALVAATVLFMHWIQILWIVVPSFYPARFHFHWMDLVTVIGIGGVWLAAFIGFLMAHSLIPLHDPRFTELAEQAEGA